MDLNIIDEIKLKGQDTFVAFVDKLSRQRNIIKRNKKDKEEIEEVVENLKRARNEWVIATMNYEFAQEDELIDYYIYLMKASQLKYDYLLKKAKERGIKWGFEDVFEIKLENQQAPKGF
ncbi:MAG: YaaL family protein [Deltaproteobacteria bacterium]